MSQKDMSKNILEKIQKEHIKPKPRWTFQMKNYGLWVSGVLAIAVGGITVSVIIYTIQNNDWDLYAETKNNLAGFVIRTLPYFWVLLLGLFLAISYYNITHTKKGYRLRIRHLLLINIGASVVLGSVLALTGTGYTVNAELEQNIPFYSSHLMPRHYEWAHPEDGVLSGRVIMIIDENNFSLQDIRRQKWLIVIDDQAQLFTPLEEGLFLRMIGQQLNQDTFQAYRIRTHPPKTPFGPCGHMMIPCESNP